jgi:hypothetical protein
MVRFEDRDMVSAFEEVVVVIVLDDVWIVRDNITEVWQWKTIGCLVDLR